MSGLETTMSGGEEVRSTPCPPEDIQTVLDYMEALMKMVQFLHRYIDRKLRFAQENCRERPREALQALRRTKWCRKQLSCIDYAVKAMSDLISIRSELIKLDQDMFDICTSASHGVEFNEVEQWAELEWKQNEDPFSMGSFEGDRVEKRVSCPEMPPTASPSPPDKTEEEEVEEQLEYLRRWARGCS